MRMFNILLAIFLISACTVVRQRQVWLGGLQRAHAAENKNVVRVYIDKWGNFYPDASLSVPYKSFFDPLHEQEPRRSDLGRGSLSAYFTHHPVQLSALTLFYKITSSSPSATDSFKAIQSAIVQQSSQSLAGLIQQSTNKVVVVLIHGFNDDNPTGDYQDIRRNLRDWGCTDSTTAYLEVYWDGLTANNGNPATEYIWGRAQNNSAYVSLAVRRLLTSLPQQTKLRIITHSLGASVGTGALFNTVSKWKKGTTEIEDEEGNVTSIKRVWAYFDAVKTVVTPTQPDIRIGMIAPAIPGVSTFCDFENRNPACTPANNNITKVVIGFNCNDYATTKRVLKSDRLSRVAGATTLGCNYKNEVGNTMKAMNKLNYKNIVDSVNFSQFECRQKPEEHGMYYYLRNPRAVDFFKNLFN